MKKKIMLFALLPAMAACERVDVNPKGADVDADSQELVSMKDVAVLLSSVDLGTDRIREVHDAVSSSSQNGYDEEYTMRNIFDSPGTGVGEDFDETVSKADAKAEVKYERPLRDVFREHFAKAKSSTRAGMSGEEYLNYLQSSDMQLYWPYSERWDGETYPVITFDPLDGGASNVGYYMDEDGVMREVEVTEELAAQRPVWVVNRNDDAGFVSLDMMRRNHPEWERGGDIVITPTKSGILSSDNVSDDGVKTLILKDFTMKRHYDSWFRGASEFFVKMGAVESFTASTEAELKLFNPSVTDFMVVVKRKELGIPHVLNTVLVSEWTPQLSNSAFMIVEDDGGTTTSWKCSAMVKYNSKSYGFDIDLPYKSSDDIVWRGQLSRKYLEDNSEVTGYFGDVMLTFAIE